MATTGTGRVALYVGSTRGRDGNTVYVVTTAVPDDAPPGATSTAQRRDALAVLSGSVDAAESDRAAIVEAEVSAAEMGSVRTPAERLAVVAELATASRTAAMLDRLTDEGVLSDEQRRSLAADEGMGTLARVLRQSEVAGHDPRHVLTTAVTERALGDVRSLASVTRSGSSTWPTWRRPRTPLRGGSCRRGAVVTTSNDHHLATGYLPHSDRTLLTVEEAARRLSLGRTTLYALLKADQIASVRIGRLRRIPTEALAAYTARLIAEQHAAGEDVRHDAAQPQAGYPRAERRIEHLSEQRWQVARPRHGRRP